MAYIRWGIRLAVLLVVLACVGVGAFNAVVYPTHGLDGFTAEDYEKVILKASALYAVSVGMSLDGILESDFRTLGPGKANFAWGIVSLRDKSNGRYRLWVSLQRFGDQWSRASSTVYPDNKSLGLIVDPWDRMLFLKDTEPNMSKTRLELDLLTREQVRRFREYMRTSL
ncbi:hypothetical protein [Megalodesulfovibrio gigas]|uniref:Uncharacterized protein n=1 Tax=Megalodesulfovibrio gigas (strain ATCC 19364 / DSM 1382 / NCIMB 9332 / VKM B-1759) TaxID=1121448 RepID=T2GC55_MEGG1|nr:hypothetical protein [Megalodesulfovibrio gigas]AGW13888.1 hypothetical protein DGI_2124 [Megalodesulfovibrio gigas DSM 1382 = ATCC 19364]